MKGLGRYTVRRAYWLGAKEAFGVPAAVLAAGYVGFGALAAGSGLSLAAITLSTAAIWALPGQLALVEMHTLGASALAVVLAVALANARFLPMTAALMPLLRGPRPSTPMLYGAAHLIAMTGWAAAMRRCPELPQRQRLPYFTGFALVCWGVSLVSGMIGYALSSSLPHRVMLGLAFLNPVYFLLILTGDARTRLTRLALGCGALAGPLAYLVAPQWSVLAGGVVGGTAAYALHRRLRSRRG